MITLQKIVDLLNELVAADPQAAFDLVEYRVPVSQAVIDHPTITVTDPGDLLGMLGILQGIAAMENEILEAQYTDDEKTLVGFRIRKKTP